MPDKVFISYRREDSRYPARRIYDAFAQSLPPDTVFMDIDSMAPGDDFVEVLEGWVQQCEVLLALIGPNWLKSTDPRTKRRRLDNPEDFVRIEVRGALARKIPVVPVLLDAAAMPTAAELPDDIKGLTRRNAEFIDFRTFDVDVQRLIKRLKIGGKVEPIAPNPEPPALDNGDRKVEVPEPGVPAITSEPDRVKIAPLRVWPAVAVSLAVIVAILLAARVIERGQLNVQDGQASAASDALKASDGARQEAEARLAAALAEQAKSDEARRAAETRAGEAADALTKTEKARQEAEAKASAASAAQARSDEGRRAAELRANDVAEALKKSEKARLDAEARATGAAAAQAKAEEAQRAAEKARAAAEGAASGAVATARNQGEAARQLAELRASDAVEALKKSEKARQEAEAKIAALSTAAPRSTANDLLTTIGGKSRWAKWSLMYCKEPKNANFLSLEAAGDRITWINGLGIARTEKVILSNEQMFQGSSGSSSEETSTYARESNNAFPQPNRLIVQPGKYNADHVGYFLERCP